MRPAAGTHRALAYEILAKSNNLQLSYSDFPLKYVILTHYYNWLYTVTSGEVLKVGGFIYNVHFCLLFTYLRPYCQLPLEANAAKTIFWSEKAQENPRKCRQYGQIWLELSSTGAPFTWMDLRVAWPELYQLWGSHRPNHRRLTSLL